MLRKKEDWKKILEEKLPPKHKYIERNKAITAHYATLYLQNQQLFKWAGMAAFASNQVGIAIAVAEMLNSPGGMMTRNGQAKDENLLDLGLRLFGTAVDLFLAIPVALHDFATRQLLLDDLEKVKNGNDEIFNDIAWAHHAYLEGGIKEIEENVSESEKEYMLAGFRMIDEGAKKLQNPAQKEEGKALIAKGNTLLLKHEQVNTIQPIFDRVSALGRMVISFGGMLDFEGAAENGQGRLSSFSQYFGNVATLSRQKCLTNRDNRWEWVENDVLPIWAKVDSSYCQDSALCQRLTAMANQEPSMLQQTTVFMNSIYPVLGLKFNASQSVTA
ncbi:MAG: hypothetical protein HGB11_07690 [Chlorobiales bacterium]|nr:hypothetical protein [Chlorobiales bacterium]